jgi:hypothetical protein
MGDESNRRRTYWRIATLIVALGLVSLFLFQFFSAKQILLWNNFEGGSIETSRTPLSISSGTNVPGSEIAEGNNETGGTKTTYPGHYNPETGIPKVTPRITMLTPPPPTTGIFEGQNGAYFHSFEAKIENHWIGYIGRHRVTVLAGAWVSDPSQGFIAVFPDNSYSSLHGNFPSPRKSGPLRIVDARGARLVIRQANDDNLLYFDVLSLTYVASLEVTVVPIPLVPIITTLQPTLSPDPTP